MLTTKTFRASRYWTTNVNGSALTIFVGGLLSWVFGFLLLWMAEDISRIWWIPTILILSPVAGWLVAYPGNWIATFPVAVEVGDKLTIFAPHKQIEIQPSEIKDVYKSVLQQGFVIRLRHRRGLLTRVVIHWFFGKEREPLIEAIRLMVDVKIRP